MTHLNNILGMRVVEVIENYLGLPFLIRKNKTNAFQHIIDKFLNRIKGRSKRLLSYDGKKVFSKFVLQYLPTYSLSIFLVPKGIVDAMVAKMRNFWWESKKRGCGWVMLKWEALFLPKGMGGLGFRDLRHFNITLFGR